jgi:hypothetical protein
MPISEDEYREPQWIRYQKGYTVSRIVAERSKFMNFELYPRSYRNGEFRQPGYNPNHQAIRVERSNLYKEGLTLKPR